MAISHDVVQGPLDSTGKKIDNVLVDTDKYRQVASIGGPDSADKDSIAAVVAAAPTTEFGLVTRNIPSGIQPVSGTVAVTGALTDTQLRATPVPISGTVTITDGAGAVNVIVDSSALPTGAATAVLQTQPGVDIGDVTINNAVGAAAVNVQDGGNSLTIDSPNLDVALSTRLKPADTLTGVTTVAAVTSITNVVHVDDNAASLTVDTPQLPSALDASGFLKTHEQGTAAVSVASLPLPTGAALEAGNLLTTTGYLSQMLENQRQEIKLLKAILMTLGNSGAGFVDPEEATELITLN